MNEGRVSLSRILAIHWYACEIFGDEKRLDALRTTALFADGRLALHNSVASPWQSRSAGLRGPRCEGPLIVIENASTWDTYSRWNSAHGSFSAVVYGGGNRFLDSVARLNDIFTEIGGPRRVLYFGDLDPQGLRIPQIAFAPRPMARFAGHRIGFMELCAIARTGIC